MKIEIIEEILKDGKKPFADIFNELKAKGLIKENQMVALYNEMSFSDKLINLSNNVWDLKERYTYDECHKDFEILDEDDDIVLLSEIEEPEEKPETLESVLSFEEK